MKASQLVYSLTILALSAASAACMFALQSRYEAKSVTYALTFSSSLVLLYPSLVGAGCWVWWKSKSFRIAGIAVSLLLLLHSAISLQQGPVGGDMDFGAWVIAVVGAIICAVASMIAMAIAAAMHFMLVREANQSDSLFK
jgi:hypothetical protein